MIRKLKKKAFTLIELLVVIAILAVLATVAIIGYGAFTKKAKESNDIYLVKQMNIVLEASEVLDGKNKTMTDALDDVFDKGYDLTKLTPTSEKYNIVWDSLNDRIVLLNDQREIVFPKEKMSANKDLYVIVSTKDEIENTYKDYSFYLRDNFNNNQEITLSISNGIDVGNNENITSISYTNGTKHTVAIRTNGGTLTINASQDTVNLFGWLKELNVQSVATSDCYHEYGFIGELKTFTSGKFVAYDGCEFHQTKEAVESVIGSNAKDLTKAKFGQHYYKNGKCVVEGCTVVDHEHVYVEESRTEATCKNEGSVQEKCTICGDIKTEIIKKLDHEWTNYTIDDSKHSRTCTKCNTVEKGKHDTSGDNGKCSICGYLGVKNGLVDGYYYKDNELYTGNEGNYEFENGILVLNGVSSDVTNTYIDTKLTFNLPTDNSVLTNKIKLKFNDNNECIKPGNYGGYEISINNETEYKYSAVNINASFDKDIFAAINMLRNSIINGETDNVLNEIEKIYHIDENYYPLLIESDDFNDYLDTLVLTEISTDDEYNIYKNAEISYEDYLKDKYNVEHLWNMNWIDVVSYASYGNWPSSNLNGKHGIFDGNHYDYRCLDLEFILLFWEHTYSQVFFVGLSENDPSNLLSDSSTPNASNAFYKYGDADWMSKVSIEYGVTLFSHKECNNGKVISIHNDKFFVFTTTHGFLMSNAWQSQTVANASFNLIIEKNA